MPEKKTYNMQEISTHKTLSSLWIVIHNNVYDVTKFFDEHPGGKDVFKEVAGGNATDSFEDLSHSTDARQIMKKYHIGEVAKENKFAEVPKTNRRTNAKSGGSPLIWVVPAAAAIGIAIAYRMFM